MPYFQTIKSPIRMLVLVTILLMGTTTTWSQSRPWDISVGYFGPIPFEPGIRIGVHTPLKQFENSAVMLNLQAAYFFRNLDNSNILLGSEIGWRFKKDEKRNINTLSIGTAYLMQFEVTGFTVNLQGDVISRERELRHIFMPTFNYEYARLIGDHWAPYLKLGYGQKFSGTAVNSGVVLWEFGTRYLFN